MIKLRQAHKLGMELYNLINKIPQRQEEVSYEAI